MSGLQHAVTILAPPDRVWDVLVDIERWPERIPTVEEAELLDGPLAVGSHVRLCQPRLPESEWTVTELVDGTSYAWESRSPGMRIVADHAVQPHPDGTLLTLSIDLSGPMAGIGWLMTRGLTRRYVETEADAIKQVAEALSA